MNSIKATVRGYSERYDYTEKFEIVDGVPEVQNVEDVIRNGYDDTEGYLQCIEVREVDADPTHWNTEGCYYKFYEVDYLDIQDYEESEDEDKEPSHFIVEKFVCVRDYGYCHFKNKSIEIEESYLYVTYENKENEDIEVTIVVNDDKEFIGFLAEEDSDKYSSDWNIDEWNCLNDYDYCE